MAEHKMRYIAQRQAGDPAPGSQQEQGGSKKNSDEIWVKKEYILFDLDGTLTDPKQGITKCVQYALHSFGIEEPDLDKLEPFIGPPLKNSFMEFYGLDDEKAEAAVAKYRERFQDTGIFENEIYKGIPEMLKKLKSRGLHLGVASSKPTVYVERILEHFKIRAYFDVVVGSELDGSRVDKVEIVQEALRQLFPSGRVQKHKVFMVGDRKFDAEGARLAGVESVGVTFGYGSMEELMEAHTDYIVRSVEELRRFLLRGYEDMAKDLGSFQKMWILVSQFIIFMAVKGLVNSVARLLLGMEPTQTQQDMITGLGYLAGGLAILKNAKGCIKRTIQDMYLTHLKEEPRSSYIILGVSTACLSVGMALLLYLSGMSASIQFFTKNAQDTKAMTFFMSVLVCGIIAPIVEELLFRGSIYGYIRKFFDVRTAIVGSAILYGVSHQDGFDQALFATVMGYAIAYAYEYFGNFWVPIFMHVGMMEINIIMTYLEIDKTWFTCWPACAVMLILGIAGYVYLARRKRVA
ncbi:MAG: HAD hydrolase-like protein [Lachnospiraceae bacterium]|nr:HAD hydrolase-like protein [Lachnospiraceae bacterium]